MLPYKQQLRRSSANKLPPISKATLVKRMGRQKINRLDVSLQLVNQFSNARALHRGSNSKSNKNSQVVSLRLRTDSVNANINYSKDYSREKDLKSEQNEYSQQKTLEDFHKNIRINKQYIHRQIKRRTEKNHKQSKQNSKSAIKQNQQKLKKQKKQKRIATENSMIFEQIQEIISSKLPKSSTSRSRPNYEQNQKQKQKLDLNHVHNIVKIAKINKNLRYLSPEQSVNSLKKSFEQETNISSSRMMLKDQNNYHEWRRVDLKSNSENPEYKLTNFQIQNQRLKQLIQKNEIGLSNYFQYKNELHLCNQIKLSSY